MNASKVMAGILVATLIGVCLQANALEASASGGWKVAYTADMKDPKLPDQWLVQGASVTVSNGEMIIKSDTGEADNVQALLKAPKFPENVRVEMIASLSGNPLTDLSVILNGSEASGFSSGYLMQFGAKKNSFSRLLRQDLPLEATKNAKGKIVQGKKHTIIAERNDGKISLTVDGNSIFEYKDNEPVKSADAALVGVYTYGCAMTIDKFVVSTKPSAVPAAAPAPAKP